MKNFKKLIGDKIYLSPKGTTDEEIEIFTQWVNDFQVTDYIGVTSGICTLASEKEYFSQLSQFADTEGALTWDSAKHTLSFSKKISDTQQLSVILKLLYPAEKNTQALNVLQWNTELTGSWTPDNSQNVFKGGK